jgi:hypothetical protein
MRRLLVAALCVAVLIALGIALWQRPVGRWIVGVFGLDWGLAGMGPLLYFLVPISVMAFTLLALYLVGKRVGRTGRGDRDLLLLFPIIGAAAAFAAVLLWLIEEVTP